MRAILMFHGVDDSGSVLSVSARELESLLAAIVQSGHQLLPLAQLLQGNDENAVALTFDDGFASVLKQGLPVVRRFGVRPTLFVTTGYVGADNRWPSQPKDAPTVKLLDWDGLAQLLEAGWDLQAHSVSHPDLRTLGPAELERELLEPKEKLRERLGIDADTLAYPYGYYDATVARAAATHYRAAVTTVFRPLSPEDTALRLPRLDAFYLRSGLVHGWFGNGGGFTGYLRMRGALRRVKHHPGEITA